MEIIRQIRKLTFAELYFRLVTLIFWPMYWYTLTVITIKNLTMTLFYIFLVLDTMFIILITIRLLRKKIADIRYFVFAFTMAVTYLVSLLSIMMYSKSVDLVYMKLSLCVILILVSLRLTKKSNNDIGLVGILTGILLMVLTYFY